MKMQIQIKTPDAAGAGAGRKIQVVAGAVVLLEKAVRFLVPAAGLERARAAERAGTEGAVKQFLCRELSLEVYGECDSVALGVEGWVVEEDDSAPPAAAGGQVGAPVS